MNHQTDEELDALVQRLKQLEGRMSFQSQNMTCARTCHLSADAITTLRTQLAEADAMIEAQAKDHAENNIRLAEMAHRVSQLEGMVMSGQGEQIRLAADLLQEKIECNAANARADRAEAEVRSLKAAIFGSENYAHDLKCGNFVEMAQTLHAAQKGGLDRAERAEAALAAQIEADAGIADHYADQDYCAMGYPEEGGIAASGTADMIRREIRTQLAEAQDRLTLEMDSLNAADRRAKSLVKLLKYANARADRAEQRVATLEAALAEIKQTLDAPDDWHPVYAVKALKQSNDRAEAALAAQIEADAGIADDYVKMRERQIADEKDKISRYVDVPQIMRWEAGKVQSRAIAEAIRAQPHDCTALDRMLAEAREKALREAADMFDADSNIAQTIRALIEAPNAQP